MGGRTWAGSIGHSREHDLNICRMYFACSNVTQSCGSCHDCHLSASGRLSRVCERHHCASSTARRPVCRLAPHALTPCPLVACAMPQQSPHTLCTSMDRHDVVAHSLEPTLWYWPLARTQIATQRSRPVLGAVGTRSLSVARTRCARKPKPQQTGVVPPTSCANNLTHRSRCKQP